MRRTLYFQFLSSVGTLLLPMMVFLAMGLFEHAQAASPAMDNSCSRLNNYGFTQGLVYCIQASIGVAVNQYAIVMQQKLLPYAGGCICVAIAIFGLKLMYSGVQEPRKEVMTLGFRILIGVFFYYEAAAIYNAIAGTFPKYDGVMNQAIGWVTGFSTSGGGTGSGNSIFGNLVSVNCTKDNPPQSYEGFQIWQAFDCIFSKVFGAANPTTHPYAFFTSLLIIVGAAFLSGTLGLTVAGLGISLFLGLLLFICRALYLVLTAYVCIGFMAIFMPLFAPLFFFESQFLTQKFKQAIGLIISCIFQAIFVVGFLGLAVSVDDQLIEGNLPGCTSPTYPSAGSLSSNAPPAGYGQNGVGVCSFTQLVDNSKKDAELQKWYSDFMEPNATLFNMGMFIDPQARQYGTGPINPITDPRVGLNVTPTPVINQAHQVEAQAAHVDMSGITQLKKFFPMKQLILTILTFIFVNYAIKGLMESVPIMAANMTIATGIRLAQQMQLPLEGAVRDFLSGANDAMMQAVRGKRGIGTTASAVARGAIAGAGNVAAKDLP